MEGAPYTQPVCRHYDSFSKFNRQYIYTGIFRKNKRVRMTEKALRLFIILEDTSEMIKNQFLGWRWACFSY